MSTKMNLSLLCMEASLEYAGGVVLEIGAVTPGGKHQKVLLKMGPNAVGHVADQLYKIVREQQKRLDSVKAKLRGEG